MSNPAEETNRSGSEEDFDWAAEKGKGCLVISFLLFLLLAFCVLAVWLELFGDNLPFIVLGLISLAILPFSAGVGIWQNLRNGKYKTPDEANSSLFGNIALFLVALGLLFTVFHFLSNFRWPG